MESLQRDGEGWQVQSQGPNGTETFRADEVVSTGSLKGLVASLGGGVSDSARQLAQGLHYRDFLIVAVTSRPKHFIADQWLYVHDERFRVGRVQNFRAWSPQMVPDTRSACFGLEYFCHEGDGLWSLSDDELLQLRVRGLGQYLAQ